MSSRLSSMSTTGHSLSQPEGSFCANLWSSYFPLILVFISGIGFSFQGLLQKLLSEHGFHATFLAVVLRGLTQAGSMYTMILISGSACCNGGTKKRLEPLLGSTTYTSVILILRGFFGFLGIGFAFLTFDRLPLGDASVLLTLGPFFAAILGALFLGEPWQLSEMVATVLSLVGACLVAKPSFLFGAHFEPQPIWGHHYHGQSSGAASLSMGYDHLDFSYSRLLLSNATNATLVGNSTDSAGTEDTSVDTASLDIVGVVFGLSCSFCSGLVFMMLRILGTTARVNWKNVGVIQGLSQFFGALPCLFMFNQLATHHPSIALPYFRHATQALPSLYAVTDTQWAMLFGCAVIGTFSQGIMTIGLQRVKSATGTAMRMSDVVSSFLLQAVVTKDAVDVLSVVGATLVLISTGIIVVYSKKNAAAAATGTSPEPPKNLRHGGRDTDSEGDVEMEMSVGTTASDISSSMLSGFSFDSGALALGGGNKKAQPQPQRPTPTFNILRRHNNDYLHVPQNDGGGRSGSNSIGDDEDSPLGGRGGRSVSPYGRGGRDEGDVEDGRLNDDISDNRGTHDRGNTGAGAGAGAVSGYRAVRTGSTHSASMSAAGVDQSMSLGFERSSLSTASGGRGQQHNPLHATTAPGNPFAGERGSRDEDSEGSTGQQGKGIQYVSPVTAAAAAASASATAVSSSSSSSAARITRPPQAHPHPTTATSGANGTIGGDKSDKNSSNGAQQQVEDDDDDDDDGIFAATPAYNIVPSSSAAGGGYVVTPLTPHTAASKYNTITNQFHNGGVGSESASGHGARGETEEDLGDSDSDADFFSCRDNNPAALTALEQSILDRVSGPKDN